MARTTPQVEHDLLYGHGGAAPIAVGSPAWFAWLEQASLFAFRSGAGSFTARRESRARGGGYWRAYRTVAGRQGRAYLGRATDLTIERLRAAAIQLAGAAPEPAASRASSPPPAPILGASAPLLTTKLYLPRPRGALVPRPRLLARLDAGTRLPLTLIAAPAGFGKTTLLADWLNQNNERRTMNDEGPEDPLHRSSFIAHRFNVAWLALDAADNDPNTFLRYLIAALRRAVPSVGAREHDPARAEGDAANDCGRGVNTEIFFVAQFVSKAREHDLAQLAGKRVIGGVRENAKCGQRPGSNDRTVRIRQSEK
jgi:LuxR family maltose regulon positive regulatory protein